MSPPKFELCEAHEDRDWDGFVDQSPQGTVFSTSAFLHALGAPVRRWRVVQAGRTLAQWALIEAGPGRAMRYPYTPYQGPMFTAQPGRLPRQRAVDEFRLTEFFVQELTARYSVLDLALCWTLADLRPFLWHNHGQAGQPRFQATPRYTALLDLTALPPDPAQVTRDWRACRRQELRKVASLSITDSTDLDGFLHLYQRTFARQGLDLPASQLDLVRRITEAALTGHYGRLSACHATQGIAAMSLFLYDRRRAYHLFAANEPAQRDSGATTRLMFDNILEAQRRGLRELDFVGVNSPARGDFKLSFNPQLKLYFELSYGPIASTP